MTGQLPPSPGDGCAKRVGWAAAIVFAVWVGAQTCGADSSPSPSLSPSPGSLPADPIEVPRYRSLCEGEDYLHYDDCIYFGDE